MDDALIVLAGATGNLGGRITTALLARRAQVRAVVRRQSAPEKLEELRRRGAAIVEADSRSVPELAAACSGASCVVSALAGLHDVILEAQTILLEAAVKAGVPRFIPSDFSIDSTKLPPGTNRNLDLRRRFHDRLERAPLSATLILNGMFTDLLAGQAPIVLFKWKRVVCWGDPDQPLDFTTIDNTAEFTAAAALDASTPRFLRIAGDQLSARGWAEVASQVTGEKFCLFRAGSLKSLEILSRSHGPFSPGAAPCIRLGKACNTCTTCSADEPNSSPSTTSVTQGSAGAASGMSSPLAVRAEGHRGLARSWIGRQPPRDRTASRNPML